jgi:hypothetical protein
VDELKKPLAPQPFQGEEMFMAAEQAVFILSAFLQNDLEYEAPLVPTTLERMLQNQDMFLDRLGDEWKPYIVNTSNHGHHWVGLYLNAKTNRESRSGKSRGQASLLDSMQNITEGAKALARMASKYLSIVKPTITDKSQFNGWECGLIRVFWYLRVLFNKRNNILILPPDRKGPFFTPPPGHGWRSVVYELMAAHQDGLPANSLTGLAVLFEEYVGALDRNTDASVEAMLSRIGEVREESQERAESRPRRPAK